MLFKKLLDVVVTETHDSTDEMTWQLPGLDHPVDGHFVELQKLRELGYRVELTRTNTFRLLRRVFEIVPHCRAPRNQMNP
jgi:hypothetical protein